MKIVISSCRVSSHNFTGLPDDTLFNVTVTGINPMGFVSNVDSTSVRTMICISMYIYTLHLLYVLFVKNASLMTLLSVKY